MSDDEIEVLEPSGSWEDGLAAPAELAVVKVPVQRVIINGSEQVVMGEACALVCPKCRSVLTRFSPGVSAVDVLKALDSGELGDRLVHCGGCGKPLRISREAPQDAQE